jgi:hypothetical protein
MYIYPVALALLKRPFFGDAKTDAHRNDIPSKQLAGEADIHPLFSQK